MAGIQDIMNFLFGGSKSGGDADDALVASTVEAVLAQRLVRTWCRECRGAGCDACRRTGLTVLRSITTFESSERTIA